MKEFIASIPDGGWLAIHFAIVVPLAKIVNDYFKIAGLWFNKISSKQIVSWVVALIVGYFGWATEIGALNDDAWYLVAAKSIIAGLAANGFWDVVKKK